MRHKSGGDEGVAPCAARLPMLSPTPPRCGIYCSRGGDPTRLWLHRVSGVRLRSHVLQAKTKQYDLWSKFYDRTFGALVIERQRRGVEELRLRGGERVLDLGVGTGATLDSYPRNVRVTGIDLSRGMLEQARRKLQRDGITHVNLVQGDALMPPFADHSFDHVLISHVITVVPEPRKLLMWAARVVKPGGRVVLVNHFRSSRRAVSLLEKVINPICQCLGWRSDLALQDVLENCPLPVAYQFKMTPMDLWQIVVLTDGQRPKPARDPQPEITPNVEASAQTL